MSKNNIIYKILSHPKCKQKRSGKNVVYNLNTLKFEVSKSASTKINNLIKKRKYKLLREFIVIYKDMFNTNFED